jgi:hypothetical protein
MAEVKTIDVINVLPQEFTKSHLKFTITPYGKHPLNISLHFEFKDIPTEEQLKQTRASIVITIQKEDKKQFSVKKLKSYIVNKTIVTKCIIFVKKSKESSITINYENFEKENIIAKWEMRGYSERTWDLKAIESLDINETKEYTGFQEPTLPFVLCDENKCGIQHAPTIETTFDDNVIVEKNKGSTTVKIRVVEDNQDGSTISESPVTTFGSFQYNKRGLNTIAAAKSHLRCLLFEERLREYTNAKEALMNMAKTLSREGLSVEENQTVDKFLSLINDEASNRKKCKEINDCAKKYKKCMKGILLSDKKTQLSLLIGTMKIASDKLNRLQLTGKRQAKPVKHKKNKNKANAIEEDKEEDKGKGQGNGNGGPETDGQDPKEAQEPKTGMSAQHQLKMIQALLGGTF